jgi:DNA polymerase type B, organellar and viral
VSDVPFRRSDLEKLRALESSAIRLDTFAPVSELRRTSEGKTALSRSKRDVRESQRRPGANGDRRFIAWDGEGITYVEGSPQSYVLFGNSEGNYCQAESLSTSTCLNLIIEEEIREPSAYHVGFGFNYDVNMILKDVPRIRLKRLRQEGSIRWGGCRIEWRPSKWFQVTKVVNLEAGPQKVTCRIWDIWGFFQASFVKALRIFLGERPEFDEIERGKGLRGAFSIGDIESVIKPYWESELRFLVLLADRLRSYLYSAGLYITQWHGPGAIASYALRKYSISEHMARCPDEVNRAAQFAYAGGRFELFKMGRYRGTVWQADIRSAYPEAISLLPSLANGTWHNVKEFDPEWRFGIYHVRMRGNILDANMPYPLFWRDKRHCIHYPPVVEGWYWAPEIANIAHWSSVEIIDGWVFHDDGSYPFSWVADIYKQREEWKKVGNPCQIALKLLLNSLYGKMAQRVGYDKKNKLPPKWHQIEWAGWVTSYTRAKLYRVMRQAGDGLIAVETDAVFSSKPLTLDEGTGLGQWDVDEWDEIIYLQSGFRFMQRENKWTDKYRGFDKGSVDIRKIEKYLRTVRVPNSKRILPFVGRTTRFVGMGLAFVSKNPNIWRTWTTEARALRMGSDGKRIHIPPFCTPCTENVSWSNDFHLLSVAKPEGGQSYPHHLPWKDDPDWWQEEFSERNRIEKEMMGI